MAMRTKSLKAPEQGYGHRDHRTPKRHRIPRTVMLKKKILQEKIQERNQFEIEKEEARQHFFRNKRKYKKLKL